METSGLHARNAFLTTLGLLVAVALVAIAARGSTAAGAGNARGQVDALLDILFTIYLIAIALGAVLLIYMLLLRRHFEDTVGAQRRRPLATLLSMLVLAGIFALIMRRLAGHEPIVPAEVGEEFVPGSGPLPQTTSPVTDLYEPEFAWIPVLVTVALLFIAVGAWWLAGRARRRARGETSESLLPGALAVAVEELLDGLRAEPDPRRAVIAAYARLERVLAAHGLPRRRSEAPLEYLGRLLESLSVTPDAVQRLTALFERAKFSQHAVHAEMKDEAIAALERVRDDLAAARARAEQERAEAMKAMLDRATR